MNRYIDQYIRNEEQRKRIEATEKVAARCAERAAKHDREGSFPFDNFADLRESGYLKLTVPKAFGGEEISLYEMVMHQERLGYGDGSTALAAGWSIGMIMHLRTTGKWPAPLFEELCRDVVRDGAMINSFASEPATGSPSRGGKPETKAVQTEGGWQLTGRKTYSTLSPVLDRFIVTATMDDEDGTIGEFLVRKSDRVAIEETWDTIGMRATGSHDVLLQDVFVPEHALLGVRGNAGGGSAPADGGGWLLHIPAAYMGIALAARDFTVKFALDYKPNSIAGPIAELPTVQEKLGQLEAELRTARSLLYAAADRWDREADARRQLQPDLGLAKTVVTNAAIRIVDLAMRIVGGASLSKNLPLERYYRDVRAGLHNPPMDNNVYQMLAQAACRDNS